MKLNGYAIVCEFLSLSEAPWRAFALRPARPNVMAQIARGGEAAQKALKGITGSLPHHAMRVLSPVAVRVAR